MLIEDNPLDVRLLREMLEATVFSGAQLSHATSLKQAMDLQLKSFPLILVDLNLPDSVGLETLLRIKNEAADSAIVVLTGLNDEEVALKAVKYGAQDYIIKGNLNYKHFERSIRYSLERNNVIVERDKMQKKILLQASILQNVRDCIIVTDGEGKIVYWNAGATILLGYSESEMIGQSPGILYPEFRSPEEVSVTLKEIKDGRDYNGEWQGKRKDGSLIWVDIKTTLMQNFHGKPIGFIVVSKNITDKKQIQEAYKTLAEFSLQGFTISQNGKIVFANKQMETITGYTIEELKSFSQTQSESLIYPDDIPLVRQSYPQLGPDGPGSFRHEFRLIRKDGTICWLDTFVTMVNYLDSPAIQAVVMDITEKKITEEKLKNSNKDLKTFVYKATHDLKGPLSSIIGLANIAGEDIQDEKALKYIAMIGESTQKPDATLNRLIEAMITKNIDFNAEPIDFRPLLDEIIKRLSYLKGHDRMRFKVSIDDAVFFSSEPASMNSVLQNLIENAIKYQGYAHPDPFVSIDISGNQQQGLTITVEDNGIGIKDNIQDKVFDMFFRGHVESNGSGLGLYIVKCAVEKLGGTIALKKNVNRRGTVFNISLKSFVDKKQYVLS